MLEDSLSKMFYCRAAYKYKIVRTLNVCDWYSVSRIWRYLSLYSVQYGLTWLTEGAAAVGRATSATNTASTRRKNHTLRLAAPVTAGTLNWPVSPVTQSATTSPVSCQWTNCDCYIQEAKLSLGEPTVLPHSRLSSN